MYTNLVGLFLQFQKKFKQIQVNSFTYIIVLMNWHKLS